MDLKAIKSQQQQHPQTHTCRMGMTGTGETLNAANKRLIQRIWTIICIYLGRNHGNLSILWYKSNQQWNATILAAVAAVCVNYSRGYIIAFGHCCMAMADFRPNYLQLNFLLIFANRCSAATLWSGINWTAEAMCRHPQNSSSTIETEQISTLNRNAPVFKTNTF